MLTKEEDSCKRSKFCQTPLVKLISPKTKRFYLKTSRPKISNKTNSNRINSNKTNSNKINSNRTNSNKTNSSKTNNNRSSSNKTNSNKISNKRKNSNSKSKRLQDNMDKSSKVFSIEFLDTTKWLSLKYNKQHQKTLEASLDSYLT